MSVRCQPLWPGTPIFDAATGREGRVAGSADAASDGRMLDSSYVVCSPDGELDDAAWYARYEDLELQEEEDATCRQCGVAREVHPAGDGLTECPGDFGETSS